LKKVNWLQLIFKRQYNFYYRKNMF
jgi:hypothetical protein